jgi:M3 family oligoendopeptidase
VEELKRENALITEYTKLTSGVQIKFKNKNYTHAEIAQFFTNPDRKIRRGACVAEGKAMKKVAKKLDSIFNELVIVRTSIAKKLGFKSFSEVGYRRMGRNCYDQNDIAKFRQNVKKYIVPLCTELKQKVSSDMGWKTLMLYDNSIFTKTEPKPIGTVEEIFANGQRMYHEMSSQTGELFDKMTQAEAFDVVARDGKWGGGYCTQLSVYKLPFILANFNGSLDDIGVLTHEFGHALAFYEALSIPRLSARGSVTYETCEVHSMSMEFLTYKWMKLFFGENKDEYTFNHIARALTFLPYGTIVDFFQQTVYDYYSLNSSDRNDFWTQAEREYLPHLSNKGIPYYRTGRRWQQKAHIFETPFYYIDYCLAQMTAFQFLKLMQDDYKGAFDKYMQFVKIGGTKPFLDIINEVGLKSPFEEDTFVEITNTLRQMLKI